MKRKLKDTQFLFAKSLTFNTIQSASHRGSSSHANTSCWEPSILGPHKTNCKTRGEGVEWGGRHETRAQSVVWMAELHTGRRHIPAKRFKRFSSSSNLYIKQGNRNTAVQYDPETYNECVKCVKFFTGITNASTRWLLTSSRLAFSLTSMWPNLFLSFPVTLGDNPGKHHCLPA